MINMLTCIMLLFVALQTTILATSYRGIDEVFKTTIKSVAETNITLIDIEQAPYFDKYYLKKYIGDNLKDNLFNYTNSFELKFFFFDKETLKPCDISVCRAVQVRLKTTYYQVFTYDKAISLYINEGKL